MPALVLCLILFLTSFLGAETTLEEFAAKLKPMAEHSTIQADYTQTRHFQELDFDMVVTGKLAQEQGIRLAWITTDPIHSVCLFTKDSFRFWDEESKRTTSLNAAKFPWIKLIFQMQSNWMTGDLKALEKVFQLKIEDATTLRLTPLEATVKQFFKEIAIVFDSDFQCVSQVVFTENSGDTITILFQNVLYDKKIPPEIWKLK